MLKPFNVEFNAAVLHMANRTCPRGWIARDDAPETLTIYGDPEVNIAARAWHDACHLIGGFEFTTAGERKTAMLQRNQLRQVFGSFSAEHFCTLVEIEVEGQALYFERWRVFPEDQRLYTDCALAFGIAVANSLEPGRYAANRKSRAA